MGEILLPLSMITLARREAVWQYEMPAYEWVNIKRKDVYEGAGFSSAAV